MGIDKALEKIQQSFNNEYATKFWKAGFGKLQKMPGSNRIFRRIATTKDDEQLQDYLTEVRYALVFVGLGFQVEIEPLGQKGPDLRVVRDRSQIFVEITRFRKIYPGPQLLDLSSKNTILQEYGNPPRDIRKAFEKLLNKFPQVAAGQEAIIAIWNDDDDMEEIEVKTAVNDLHYDAIEGKVTIPTGLLFVLYGSKWVGGVENKQFHCFPISYSNWSLQMTLMQQLETSTVLGLVQQALANS